MEVDLEFDARNIKPTLGEPMFHDVIGLISIVPRCSCSSYGGRIPIVKTIILASIDSVLRYSLFYNEI